MTEALEGRLLPYAEELFSTIAQLWTITGKCNRCRPKTATYMQLAVVVALVLALAARVGVGQVLSGCKATCGNVSIPYPFGVGVSSHTGDHCFMEEDLELTCKKDNSGLYHGDIQILNITLQGQIDMNFFVSKVCKDQSRKKKRSWNDLWLLSPTFTISSKDNNFISVGCDTYSYLNSFNNGKEYSTGCFTKCDSISDSQSMQIDGKCSGIGCCQVDVPLGMKNITMRAYTCTFDNSNDTWEFNNCSYSFVAKKGYYYFSTKHLKELPFERTPLVAEWSVGNSSCKVSKGRIDYACRNNSYCEDSDGNGYRCMCNKGYEGNPYHPDGCRDIKECQGTHDCISDFHCRETEGSFKCFCPKGEYGDGKKEGKGKGCQQKESNNVLTKVAIGVGAGIMALLVGTWLYLIYQKRKLIKLKENFFRKNGGIILKQQLSSREDSSQSAQIFTEEQLNNATKNFDESLIIGRGGYGIVYKGILLDNRVVAVKKSKVVDKSQIEQFINEVVVLSQINHRNVVKLLGCCLETEVPLLVYEFVNNGTLFDYLHNEDKATNVSWINRLRIATETAGALSYLHSAASIPIIHRDVKSANILLDDTYTAKVSDFGASRLVPLDQTELATMVQGTLGYLDPEYMQTSQLTEKSDVYSFGVVIVELLTGEKALSFERPEGRRSLAMHFLSCFKEGHVSEVVENCIFNEENKVDIMKVVVLATRCLRLRGEERPSMKEVAMELEGIRLVEKHPWTKTNQNLEETRLLLHEGSSIYEHGDSSTYGNSGYDSLRNHVLNEYDEGR